MKKARQFQRGSGASSSKTETSLWTETPAERQQRLADEVMGKKRKATDPVVDPEVEAAKRRKKDEEAAIKAQVEEYNVGRNLLISCVAHCSVAQEPGIIAYAAAFVPPEGRRRGQGHLGPFPGHGNRWSPHGR